MQSVKNSIDVVKNFLMNVLRSYSHYQIPWKRKKNALDEKNNALNGREAELNQVQDALTAKLNELENKEVDLKAWEQKTRADLKAEEQAQLNELLEKKVAQENDLMKRQQELQIEKLQAQNLSSELKAERESINVMRENFKLFPDQMLTSEKRKSIRIRSKN